MEYAQSQAIMLNDALKNYDNVNKKSINLFLNDFAKRKCISLHSKLLMKESDF